MSSSENAANEVDSRTITAGTGANIISVAVPLCNILTLMDKLLPLDSAEYRVYLTVADILNISCKDDGTASTLTGFSLSDFQIHYKAVTFDAVTDQMIKSQVQPDGAIYFKSENLPILSRQPSYWIKRFDCSSICKFINKHKSHFKLSSVVLIDLRLVAVLLMILNSLNLIMKLAVKITHRLHFHLPLLLVLLWNFWRVSTVLCLILTLPKLLCL
jgi:hypothetical protein